MLDDRLLLAAEARIAEDAAQHPERGVGRGGLDHGGLDRGLGIGVVHEADFRFLPKAGGWLYPARGLTREW